jgi:hypothetical protein
LKKIEMMMKAIQSTARVERSVRDSIIRMGGAVRLQCGLVCLLVRASA